MNLRPILFAAPLRPERKQNGRQAEGEDDEKLSKQTTVPTGLEGFPLIWLCYEAVLI